MSDMRSSPFYIDARGVPLKVLRANGKVKLISSCDDANDFNALKGIHSHFTYEIFFVTQGKLELVTEEQTFVYEKEIVIIPPHFSHYSFPHGDGCFCLLFIFERKDSESNISGGIEKMLSKGICELPLSDDVAFYIHKVSEKNNDQTEAAEKDAELLTTLIFGEIMQCFIPYRSAPQKVKGSDSKHIYAIERYINGHVNERIYLSDVAAYTYLSNRHISRIVRQEYGCTIGELVKDKKLAVAKMLLKNTDMRVSEIAAQVNVGTENYFYLLFSQKYGMSPLQYRKKKRGIMEKNFEARVETALAKSKKFIEDLTVDSAVNRPGPIVTSGNQFFSWDNEQRSRESGQPYLYSWSYYNGVVFEGLKYIYEKTGDERYMPYIREYLDAMITDGALNEHAGYVPYHGLDCYKTASLLADFCEFDENGKPAEDKYCKTAAGLYHDLVTVNAGHTEECLGGNYWHTWHSGKTPVYKVWLDGLYMAQPFIARYVWKIQDTTQQEAVYKRFRWVADNMLAPNGLYYHAANSKDDVCKFFWLRAIGWYGMAQVDVMEYMPEEYLPEMKRDLKRFIDSMLKFQNESGMWKNLVDQPLTEVNRTETSGTAMIVYCILKAIRKGWLEDTDGAYKYAAQKAFCYMSEEKLGDNGLKDIYLVASAYGQNVYEILDRYKEDEGKGTGPYIMAYAEMIKAE